ncbi:MAG: hypothetical protein DHS20C08_06930 [Rhodomicrobium sp.]|nr:MAG: hypothetical protein DHS20C08_06930 [Rhodomicrobium sp.]
MPYLSQKRKIRKYKAVFLYQYCAELTTAPSQVDKGLEYEGRGLYIEHQKNNFLVDATPSQVDETTHIPQISTEIMAKPH